MKHKNQTWKEILINYLLVMMILPFGGMMLIMQLAPDGGGFVKMVVTALVVTILAGIYNLLKAIFYKFQGEKKELHENE